MAEQDLRTFPVLDFAAAPFDDTAIYLRVLFTESETHETLVLAGKNAPTVIGFAMTPATALRMAEVLQRQAAAIMGQPTPPRRQQS